jgi:hypothetical protein
VSHSLVALPVVTAALLFRAQGDSRPVTVAKTAGLVVRSLAAVTILGIVIVRLA